MTTARRRPRVPKKPKLGSAISGVGLAVALFVFAVELLHVFEPADPAGPWHRLLGVAVVVFLIQALAAIFQALAFAAALLGRALAGLTRRDFRRHLAGLPVAVALFLFGAPRLNQLFSGPWIMQQSWRPALLVILLLSGAFVLAFLASRAARSYLETGRIPTRIVVASAALAPVLFLVDAHESLARKYLAAHDLLAATALVLVVIAGSRFTRLSWRRFGLYQVLIGALAALSLVFGVIPGDSVQLRDVLLGRSRVLGRILGEIVPPLNESETDVDLDFLRALERRTELAPELLDEALPGRERLNIVVITVDTLRHDACSLLGGRPGDTPTLDAFLEKSQLFPRGWTQFPSSRFALNSMMTGRYPTKTDLHQQDRASDATPGTTLDTSLADELAAGGFRREAVTAFPADFMARESAHLQRGFDRFDNLEGEPLELSRRVVDASRRILQEAREADERLFLWTHVFDLHRPYRARDGVPERAPARDRYRAELRHVDSCLKELFDAIDFDDTIVVLHSDHGEEFEEHGGVGHHSSLYEEQIRVPVAIRVPGQEGRRFDTPIELIDLRPTLAELVRLAPDPRMQGQSYASLVLDVASEKRPVAAAFAQFREPRFVQGNLDALLVDHLKLIHDRKTGLFELYDLERDPGETHNLALSRPGLLEPMRSKLAAMRRYLGLRLDPVLDFGGKRLIDEVTAQEEPSSEDLDRLVARLRDPTPLEHGALDGLLEHGDPRLRRMATMRIATHPETASIFTLRDWSNAGERELQLEAALGLSLLGNDGFREDLTFLQPDFSGELRLLGMLARYAGGESELADSVHQVLGDPNNDRDLDSLGFAVLGRMGDPRALLAFYQRLIIGISYAEQLELIWDGIQSYAFDRRAPLLRLFLQQRDRAMRTRVESWLERFPEKRDWAAAAMKAETLARQARDMGVSEASFLPARELYRQALKVMADAGSLDWGLMMELSFLYNVCGRRAEFGAEAERLLEDLPAADTWSRGLALRLVGLARFADRPVRARIEPILEEAPRPGEYGRVLVLLRLEVDQDSAALVGAMGPKTEYLGAAVLNAFDKPMGKPDFLPIPTTTVQPGESVILAVPVLIDFDMSTAPRVGVRLGRADLELAPPIVIESLR